MRFAKPYPGVVLGTALIITALVALYSWQQALKPLIVDDTAVSISLSGERIYQGEPLTGQAVTFYPNGQMASADEFVDGRRQGYARSWFPNGVMAYEVFYSAEQKQGLERSWWANGQLRYQLTFVDGLQEGEGWHWYRSGAKFKKSNHLAGQPVGIQQAWRENGELFSNFEYRNGRIYGLRKANTCVGIEDQQISLEYYDEQAG